MYEGKKDLSGSNQIREREIEFIGFYDHDGDLSTTDDQHYVSYTIPIDYLTGEGIIKRNTVYRLTATIKGLGQNNLAATWETLDWVMPAVHNEDVGI